MTPSEIKALRHKHGWTQDDLAAKLDYNVSTIQKWEQGLRRPSTKAKIKMEPWK